MINQKQEFRMLVFQLNVNMEVEVEKPCAKVVSFDYGGQVPQVLPFAIKNA
ncbi:MAG TPA: hypothetical protein VGH22_12400 [Candidatus Binatia bacterium]|jgi:hypothetical protein